MIEDKLFCVDTKSYLCYNFDMKIMRDSADDKKESGNSLTTSIIRSITMRQNGSNGSNESNDIEF